MLVFLIFSLPLWSQEESIEDLSYEELVSRSLKLGIDTSGNRFILEERLRGVIDLDSNESNQDSQESLLTEIENADAGSYLQSGEDNELLLQGNVRIVVEDTDNDITNTISADYILYNQEQQQLSARGNVVYSIDGRQRTEEFTGDQLLFLLNENDTIFFEGGGLTEQDATGDSVDILKNLSAPNRVQYYYQAEFITRNSDNIIIMDNGIITSSRDPSPTYRLQFKKLWLLSPSEVGVEELVLYVGNIPLFGLPFLYLPGNEVVFSPVFALNDDRGIGINTTTYFAGQKENDDQPFSFLQLGTERSESAVRPMGIFLQPYTESEEDSAESETSESEENNEDSTEVLESAKLYLDVYAKRGLFFGFGVDFNPSDAVTEARGLALFAITRELYRIGEETSSLYQSESGEIVSHWHESRLGGVRIPLRFILELEVSLRLDAFTLGVNIPIYSDPYIHGEFFTRQENIPWDDLIFGTNIEDQMLPTTQRAMNWNVNFSINPNLPSEIRPFINRIGIGSFQTRFAWRTVTVPNEEVPLEHRNAINSPERLYYAPDRFQIPSGSLSISGELINAQLPDAESENTAEEEGERVLPSIFDQIQAPEGIDQESTNETDANSNTSNTVSNNQTENGISIGNFIRPQSQANTQAATVNTPFNYTLGYSASNNHSLAFVFNDFGNDEHEVAYSRFEDTISASISQNMRIFQSLLSIQSILRYSGSLIEPFGFSSRLSDQQRNNINNQVRSTSTHTINLENTASVNFLEPFRTDLTLGLNYRNVLRIWESRLNNDGDAQDNIFEWDSEHVTTHSISSNFMLPLLNNAFRQGLTFSIVLPPLNETISTGYTLGIGPIGSEAQFMLTSTATLDFVSRNDVFNLQDIAFTFNTQIFKEISISANFSWELESDFVPQQYEFDLDFFWYKGSIEFLDRQISQLNERRTAWVRQTETEFLLSSMQHSLDIPIKFVEEDMFEFNSSIGFRWNHDFVEFTSSRLTFNFSIGILIPQFLLIRFSVASSNNAVYRYFPEYNELLTPEGEMSLPTLNLFDDLFRSFNFFDDSEREDSNFKLDSLSLELYHDLGDWLLSFSYNWRPTVETTNGQSVYQIENRFSIFLQWLPIEELNNEITIEEEGGEWQIDY